MKINFIIPLFLMLALLSACSDNEMYLPEKYLNQDQQKQTLIKILPYCAKFQKKVSWEQRFSPEMDTFYLDEVKHYKMQHYYISDKDGYHYFMLNRVAPSVHKKRVSIAGRYKLDPSGKITEYEESFWTFKMKEEELSDKGKVLFEKYVAGNDLSEFYPGKKGEEEWIEFPDANCFYDKKEHRWRFTWEASN